MSGFCKNTSNDGKVFRGLIFMDRIAHFFECLLPISICNLECEYCYLIQQNRRRMKNAKFDYSIEHMVKALSKDRLGGACYFSLCGAGETCLQEGLIELVLGLLKEGHYINITTNGTISSALHNFTLFDDKLRDKIQVAFSLHYLELKKRNMLDLFFENVNKVKNAGISIVVQMNLYDGYIEYLDEIKTICLKEVGALPQIALTRMEENHKFHIMSNMSEKEYYAVGKKFKSPLFDVTVKNFNVKRREFCYAGDWSATINLKNGIMDACYGAGYTQNIFEKIDNPIKFEAIGHGCPNKYCVNSSHFMSLGVIPRANIPSYVDLRDRKEAHWYNANMKEFLSQKFIDSKSEYGMVKKLQVDCKNRIRKINKILEYIKNRLKRG